MSQCDSSIIQRINDLQEERAALYTLPWRSDDVKQRLAEINDTLESLWNKRRLEQAGHDPNGRPDNIVYSRPGGSAPPARFGPRANYRRGRAERKTQV